MNKYEHVMKLGRGTYGDVILVNNTEENKKYAIKRLFIDENNKEQLNNEINVLKSLDHPNIIKYYESFLHKDKLCIVMDYADLGDLSKRIKLQKKNQKEFDESEVLNIFCQLALALHHVHSKNIIHRDIKSQNVFINSHSIIKLGDFGISKALNSSGEFAKTSLGTPYYLSPEICSGQSYNGKTDIWMLGCLLYEICTFNKPFDGSSLNVIVNNILQKPVLPVPKTYSNLIQKLIDCTLEKNQTKRFSINEILEISEIFSHVNTILKEPAYKNYQIEIQIFSDNKKERNEEDKKDEFNVNSNFNNFDKNNEENINPDEANEFNYESENVTKSALFKYIEQSNMGSIKEDEQEYSPDKKDKLNQNQNSREQTRKLYQREISIETNFDDPKQPEEKKVKPKAASTKSHIRIKKLNEADLINKKGYEATNKPDGKQYPKHFIFSDNLFNQIHSSSPNRPLLFKEFLIQKLGEIRFQNIMDLIIQTPDPMKILNEQKNKVLEIIGEENAQYLPMLKFIASTSRNTTPLNQQHREINKSSITPVHLFKPNLGQHNQGHFPNGNLIPIFSPQENPCTVGSRFKIISPAYSISTSSNSNTPNNILTIAEIIEKKNSENKKTVI